MLVGPRKNDMKFPNSVKDDTYDNITELPHYCELTVLYWAWKNLDKEVVGLVLLLPMFLVVAILMKKEEPKGPIFFSQIRVGKNETTFKMFKFRSMCVDAEEKLADLL